MTIELVEIYTPKMLRYVINNFLDNSQYALAFSEREGDYVTQNSGRGVMSRAGTFQQSSLVQHLLLDADGFLICSKKLTRHEDHWLLL